MGDGQMACACRCCLWRLGSFTWHGFNQPVFLLFDILGVLALVLVLIWQFAMRLSVNHLRAFIIMFALMIPIFALGVLGTA